MTFENLTEAEFEAIYTDMMAVAEQRHLCPNCFHTQACCDEHKRCPQVLDYDHVCTEQEDAPS